MRRKLLNLALLAVGLALLARLVVSIGPGEIARQLLALGWSFAAILAIYTVEVALESEAWRRMVSPAAGRPGYFHAICINVGGSGIGGLFPGIQMSEVAKAQLMRGRVPTHEIVSSLLLYNYLYALTNGLMCLCAPLLMLGGPLSRWAALCVAAAAVYIGALSLAGVALRRGLIGRLVRLLVRIGWKSAARFEHRAAEVDARLHTYRHDHPADFRLATGLLLIARCAQVAEFVVILHALGAGTSIAESMLLATVLSVFDWATMFVPQRTGFLEAGAFALFKMVGYSPELGLAAELVRRLRKLIFAGVGFVLATLLARTGGEGSTRKGGENSTGGGS